MAEAHDSWDYHSQGLSGPGGAMADAAFTSLVSQASISLINNQGNIGKVLAELGSSASLRNLATSVAAAGLTQGLADAPEWGTAPIRPPLSPTVSPIKGSRPPPESPPTRPSAAPIWAIP
ncbi:MAG: DUF637 domain-containing protein [Magnetospirillum gryphiswaldense]|nr:DUF637 domain-containing protein [Magnetospirillum gryphiswaldense]